ncbi:hypothetical protein BV20DRAFT_967252 [Pilatotrama ljubarskyi]|nr:hypothetical protein BV20DRAFT_967252 [Pilatotrama ljubarskyi]
MSRHGSHGRPSLSTLTLPVSPAQTQMPRKSIDNPVASSSRPITRSMTNTKPLEDIVNTTIRSGLPSARSASKLRCTGTSKARARQAKSASDETTPKLAAAAQCHSDAQAPLERPSFKTGDKVEVYMPWRGQYRWRPGKVIISGTFNPRKTPRGTFAYPVLLDQRYPRIVHWFEEGRVHAVDGRP